MFIFGLTADEVAARQPHHDPWSIYRGDAELRRVLDMIAAGAFSGGDRERYRPVVDSLLAGGDHYLLLADYASYVAAQDRVDASYRDEAAWTRKAILNVARMGRFSSDRTIRQYAEEIWDLTPVII